jgi:hypothetical protein
MSEDFHPTDKEAIPPQDLSADPWLSCARDNVGRAHGSLDFGLWTYRERQQENAIYCKSSSAQSSVLEILYLSFKGHIAQTSNSVTP